MIVVQQVFTRPNTSVQFYSSGSSANSEVLASTANGDIQQLNDSLSGKGLVMTRTIGFTDQAAFDRVSANPTIAENKQNRTTYNATNGISEATTVRTV